MKRTPIVIAAALCLALSAGVALASWYDDYDAGVDAARKGQWQVVVQKMTAAINGNGKEADRTRTYGAIFINYHPYYYRAVANLNLGKYQQAISDLEKTSGPGEENLGSIDELMRRAKAKQAEATAPVEPPPSKPPVTTTVSTPVQPVGPTIDNALRTRARAALDQARTHVEAAQQRKATASPQYQNALNAYTDANTRLATAKSNDDLNAVVAAADNITLLADSAQAPSVPTVVPPISIPTRPVTRPDSAAGDALAATRNRLRHALQSYFSGDFGEAAQQRKATASPQYQNALNAYTEANTRLATAKSNDDLNAVVAAADNITLLADSAQAPSAPTLVPSLPTPTHPVTRPESAAGDALAATRNRLRHALQSYFSGDFGEAAQQFETLTRDLPTNGWIWAFLGASQYSQYAFEGEDSYKASAIDSFRKAKTFGKWRDGLPQKYFSRKIRKAFKETTG